MHLLCFLYRYLYVYVRIDNFSVASFVSNLCTNFSCRKLTNKMKVKTIAYKFLLIRCQFYKLHDSELLATCRSKLQWNWNSTINLKLSAKLQLHIGVVNDRYIRLVLCSNNKCKYKHERSVSLLLYSHSQTMVFTLFSFYLKFALILDYVKCDKGSHRIINKLLKRKLNLTLQLFKFF